MAVTLQNVPAAGARVGRYPQHRWQIRHEAFQIQPFLIAPVLPGETLKRAVFQARAVTDPVKNPLIGWWLEYYFFYVKLRDLDGRDDFTGMLIDVDKSLSAYHAAASTKFYHDAAASDQVPWTSLCLKRIVEEYFRDDGETWNTNHIDNVPLAQINQKSWLDSALLDAEYLTEDRADDDDTPASEMETMLRKWEFMRAVGMTEMDYDQFLKTFGIKGQTEEAHRPELLRYVREWSYPANTVDPTDGDPSSAVSWSVRDRIDKDRFFKEHGFIVGVSIARPKVYLKGQTASAVTMMDTAFSWLPAVMRDEAYTSLKKIASGQAPLKSVSTAYWVDIRDLFLYGDQFCNFAMTATDAGIVAAPTTGLEKRYAAETELDALFDNAAGGFNLVRQDGVITFNILGTQIDQTPKSAGYA